MLERNIIISKTKLLLMILSERLYFNLYALISLHFIHHALIWGNFRCPSAVYVVLFALKVWTVQTVQTNFMPASSKIDIYVKLRQIQWAVYFLLAMNFTFASILEMFKSLKYFKKSSFFFFCFNTYICISRALYLTIFEIDVVCGNFEA